MTTIKDVAKYANVSVATVSRVLNNKGYVSKEAETAVQKAITDLNYRPSAVARSLYDKKSRMIGLLIPDIANPFFPEIARGIEDVALKAGYTVVLCNTDNQVKKRSTLLKYIRTEVCRWYHRCNGCWGLRALQSIKCTHRCVRPFH